MTPLARRLLDSFLAALAVALVTHVVTVVLFAAINGATVEVLAQVNGVFGFSSLLLFIFVAVIGTAGVLDNRWISLAVAVLAAFVSSWLGALLAIVAAGNPISGELIDYLWISVFGFNLLFQVVAVLAVVTVGRRVWMARQAGAAASR
ncbi:MAG: hypothetical protein K2X36_04890, partial [Microbacteriaceae bacterium]|nr:hypothetical protein [Microbacteriaceae bacterium]